MPLRGTILLCAILWVDSLSVVFLVFGVVVVSEELSYE